MAADERETFPDPHAPALDVKPADRARLLEQVHTALEEHARRLPELPVAQPAAAAEIRARLAAYDFEEAGAPERVVEECVDLLARWTVHTAHPAYFGLFNPAPAFLGVLGDLLTAAFNPQLAAWTHAPAANEIEQHLVRFMGDRLGLPSDRVCGTFTTGGAEANLTGVLVALTRAFPEVGTGGVRALPGQPVFYTSQQSHLAWLKIAHACGLGRDAARLVPVDRDLRMDTGKLRETIRGDRAAGHLPFLVIPTAGTTAAGIIDPLPDVIAASRELGLQVHVDAAWGGAVALSDSLRPLLQGIGDADSVTVDAHKWLSMPMGAGMFLGTDLHAVQETFRVTTGYMPPGVEDTHDPYVHSVQWSRRAIGLKLFLTLATIGRDGYARQLERDCQLGDLLRQRLQTAGWRVVNDTPLPVACFVDASSASSEDELADSRHEAIAGRVVSGGRAWISTVHIGGRTALRACVTSFHTGSSDLNTLVDALDVARSTVGADPAG